jgi:LemA protein
MAAHRQEQFLVVEEARVMKIALAILAILLVIALLLGSSFVSRRNQMAIKREGVNAAWSQVDVVLQRRADLIPNLVETVKGYAAQEVTVFGDIAKARSALLGATTPADKIAANQRLDSALGRLLVVVENYPQLKSNENFLRLQDELAGTENRIAVERRRYNETLQDYNTYISLFPNSLVASLSGFARNDAYFKADEGSRQVPKVNFENPKAPVAPAQAPVAVPAKP